MADSPKSNIRECVFIFLFSFFFFFLLPFFVPILPLEKGGTKSSRFSVYLGKEGSYLFILWTELENRHLTMQYLLTVDATPHTELLPVFDLPTLLPPLHVGTVQPRAS